MKWLLWIDTLKTRIQRCYYKKLFQAWTGCREESLTVLGKVYLKIPKYQPGSTKITIGKNVTLYEGVCLWGDGPISIGDNTTIFRDVVIYSSEHGGVVIGKDVMAAGFCYLTDSNHGMERNKGPMRSQTTTAKPIVIEDDVWLGQGVTVLGGSVIHTGAVVGAQSLVNREIPSNCIAAGSPAKECKQRE